MRRSSTVACDMFDITTVDDHPTAPPSATDWIPTPVKKSPSDPNISRLPDKMISRLLTRIITMMAQRLVGTNRLVSMTFAELSLNLRKSEWLMKLFVKNLCQPVVQCFYNGTLPGDGLPFFDPNSP